MPTITADQWVTLMVVGKQGAILLAYFCILALAAREILRLRRLLADAYWLNHRYEQECRKRGIVVYTYKAKDGSNCFALGAGNKSGNNVGDKAGTAQPIPNLYPVYDKTTAGD